ncbi:hypothetical protein [Pseudobacteriovorax antillogorgiicola]|uniref:hypothetical protein n=1 Tax=Pseudobacteriovorax antillogorgiicola TaxID=1513793 RepID=UPI001045E8A1|nr:hypothetical protein [Pseudobacteriovorax antillogorgiicola]
MITKQDIKDILKKDFYEDLAPSLKQLWELTPQQDGHSGEHVEARFPKKCTKCGHIYHSPTEFMSETNVLDTEERDICYQIAGRTRIFRYRNCPPPCNSTLVVVTEERRDTSKLGLERRRLFGVVHRQMNETLANLSPGVTHSLTLYLFRAIAFEGLSPMEAYVLMKRDIETKRFLGFEDEAPVLVENVDDSKAG